MKYVARKYILVFGLVVGAASLAGYFGRVHWLLDLCSQFRLPYVYLFGLLLAIAALSKKWRFSAVFLCLLGINAFTAFGDLFPAATASAAGTEPLRVVQMNIWVMNHDYGRLVNYIRTMNADIIGIEEYSNEADKAFSRLGVFGTYPYHLSFPTSDHNSKMALLSKSPLSNIRRLFSSTQNDCTLVADVTAGDRSVTLMLMHPRPPVRPTLYDRSCSQLKTAASARAPLQKNVIVMGDLNTTQYSWKFDDFASAMGVRDTRLGFGPAPSWPVWLPVLPIDFVLVSSGINVLHFALGAPTGSDHAPVIADLRI